MKKVWITWESQRRSKVLSKEFDTKFYELLKNQNWLIRCCILIIATAKIINNEKPDVLFVQNPSMILALFVCIIKHVNKKLILIIDRHSNFGPRENAIIDFIFQKISKFTIKKADITIVTNEYLSDLVKITGGNGMVLKDKIPELIIKNEEKKRLDGKFNIIYICSFSRDEPINEVLKAASYINDDIHLYISGNYKKLYAKNLLKEIGKNVTFLGYVNEDEFKKYLNSVDTIIVLTKNDHTLTCGAYEGVSVGKPIIISNFEALRNYFYKGSICINNSAKEIAEAILKSRKNHQKLTNEIHDLKMELNEDWKEDFKNVSSFINRLYNDRQKQL